MKSSVYRIFPFILGFVLSLSSISCKDDSSENDKPGKLTTPVLTLSEADGTLSAEWTAVEVTEAFCHRAALAHQLVSKTFISVEVKQEREDKAG